MAPDTVSTASRAQAIPNVSSARVVTGSSRNRLVAAQKISTSCTRDRNDLRASEAYAPPASAKLTQNRYKKMANHHSAGGIRSKHRRGWISVASRNTQPVSVVTSTGIDRSGYSKGIE